jgi:hypothetical protein
MAAGEGKVRAALVAAELARGKATMTGHSGDAVLSKLARGTCVETSTSYCASGCRHERTCVCACVLAMSLCNNAPTAETTDSSSSSEASTSTRAHR